jgi:hypothetical protein
VKALHEDMLIRVNILCGTLITRWSLVSFAFVLVARQSTAAASVCQVYLQTRAHE